MRNSLSRCVTLIAVLSSLAACGGGGGGGGEGGGGGSFSLRGTLPRTAALRSTGPAEARAVSASDVKTVLALSTGDQWWSGTVGVDGAFALEVDPSTPVGLVFADAADAPVGYLALSSGLAALPLNALPDGTASLELGALLAGAEAFVPGADPTAFAGLSQADVTALLQSGGIFAETLKNPDADGDGRIDLLQGVRYRPFVMYFVNPGAFSGLTAQVTQSPLTLNSYRFCLGASGRSSYPSTVTFTGPPGSGLEGGRTNDGTPNRIGGSAVYGSPALNVGVPPAGDYGVTLGSTPLTFHVPDQTEAIAQFALAVPTVALNDDGTVHRIDWTYQLGGLSGAAKTVLPQALVRDMILQVEADSTEHGTAYRCASSPVNAGEGPTRIYDSTQLAASVTSEVLSCQNIPWSVVSRVFMAYNDVFGNHVVVGWGR